jgi:amino acid transporter
MSEPQPLARSLGVVQATALNVANMVGIGPFITIPLFIAAMGGPHAMIGWIIAGVLVTCDGLVWSELGAALPGSGGTYHFLREIFGRYRLGRLLPFLFIWQFLISGTLELASGYIGMMQYVEYVLPDLGPALADRGIPQPLACIAAALAILVTLVLCRPMKYIGWLGVILCTGTIITVSIMIIAGLANFRPELLTMPADAFDFGTPEARAKFAIGLGGAMRIAIYDYLGYYNICHLGDEVRDPGRTIPRAVMISVVLVAAIYMTMNISIIAVVPWQEAMESKNIAALFMEKLYGRDIAVAFTWMVIWTAVACVFAATLGYSRIPYAAAKSGDFFRSFAYLDPVRQYPAVSLWAVGGLTALFCFFSLQAVIDAAVTVRIAIQFISQIVALHVLRKTRPDVERPFKMWLYPLPSLIAFIGWFFVFATAGWQFILAAIGVVAAGIVAFAIRERLRAQ